MKTKRQIIDELEALNIPDDSLVFIRITQPALNNDYRDITTSVLVYEVQVAKKGFKDIINITN